MTTKLGTGRLNGVRFVALAVFLAAGSFQGHCQQRRPVGLVGIPATVPLSPGMVVGNTLYVSGLQGTDRNGKLTAGFETQTRTTLDNVRAVVETAGFDMRDVVMANVYLTDMRNFAAMNKIYAATFSSPRPTRTTVQVAALSNGAEIEISAIAVKGK